MTFYKISCILFGFLGVHKFYNKQYKLGFLYFFTFGLLTLGWIYDVHKLLIKNRNLLTLNDENVVNNNTNYIYNVNSYLDSNEYHSLNFLEENSSKINLLENKIYKAIDVSKTNDIDEKIKLSKISIEAFYELKEFCYSHSEYGKTYFNNNWLNCHNSKKQSFSYISSVEEHLNFLIQNYDSYKASNKTKKITNDDLLNFIKDNPNIIQTDIYDTFNFVSKDSIRTRLYKLESNNKITRQKNGRTYLINIK